MNFRISPNGSVIIKKRGENPNFPSQPGKRIPSSDEIRNRLSKRKQFPQESWYQVTRQNHQHEMSLDAFLKSQSKLIKN